MQHQPNHPYNLFRSWFSKVPVLQQQYLARLFFVCTTDNSADFTLTPEEALARFNYYIAGNDFLLRRLSRLIVLCAVFDLILNNRERLQTVDQQIPGMGGDQKVARLSEKQWEKTVVSWRRFRNTVLTDRAIYAWL